MLQSRVQPDDPTLLVHGLEAKEILFVDISVLHWDLNRVVKVFEEPKPSRGPWADFPVFVRAKKNHFIHRHEVGFVLLGKFDLVVHEWQEGGTLHVRIVVKNISPVVRRPYGVLCPGSIHIGGKEKLHKAWEGISSTVRIVAAIKSTQWS
jgi:hypothetical protein